MFSDFRRYKKEINLLINALTRMSKAFDSEAAITEALVNVPEIPALAMSPRDAFMQIQKSFHLQKQITVFVQNLLWCILPEFLFLFPGNNYSRKYSLYSNEY